MLVFQGVDVEPSISTGTAKVGPFRPSFRIWESLFLPYIGQIYVSTSNFNVSQQFYKTGTYFAQKVPLKKRSFLEI